MSHTTKRRVYIAGPMTGHPDLNYPAFFQAAQQLTDAGYDPINPARDRDGLVVGVATWQDFMRAALRDIADADGVAFLPGWVESRGASIEVRLAGELGIKVAPLGLWIWQGDA